jgi:hypothetical protein
MCSRLQTACHDRIPSDAQGHEKTTQKPAGVNKASSVNLQSPKKKGRIPMTLKSLKSASLVNSAGSEPVPFPVDAITDSSGCYRRLIVYLSEARDARALNQTSCRA